MAPSSRASGESTQMWRPLTAAAARLKARFSVRPTGLIMSASRR